jgi:hypothetical protein
LLSQFHKSVRNFNIHIFSFSIPFLPVLFQLLQAEACSALFSSAPLSEGVFSLVLSHRFYYHYNTFFTIGPAISG